MAVVRKSDKDSFDTLFRRFKRKVQEDGTLQELKKREYYLSPAQKRRRKSEQAQARLRKKQNKVIIIKDEY